MWHSCLLYFYGLHKLRLRGIPMVYYTLFRWCLVNTREYHKYSEKKNGIAQAHNTLQVVFADFAIEYVF